MDRSEVYAVISSERDYQDEVIKNKYSKEPHGVAAEILMMEEYLGLARNYWTFLKGDDSALDSIRKVAALAVRCMENHGVKARLYVPTT